MSEKDQYLRRKYNLDRRYGINYGRYKPKVFSPYEGFDKDTVLERDNFTCQWCGYTPTKDEITAEKMSDWFLWRDPCFLCMYIKPRVRICWSTNSLRCQWISIVRSIAKKSILIYTKTAMNKLIYRKYQLKKSKDLHGKN